MRAVGDGLLARLRLLAATCRGLTTIPWTASGLGELAAGQGASARASARALHARQPGAVLQGRGRLAGSRRWTQVLRGAGWQPLEAGRAAAAACRSRLPALRHALAVARCGACLHRRCCPFMAMARLAPCCLQTAAAAAETLASPAPFAPVPPGALRPATASKERLSLKATVIFEASWKKIEEKYREVRRGEWVLGTGCLRGTG